MPWPKAKNSFRWDSCLRCSKETGDRSPEKTRMASASSCSVTEGKTPWASENSLPATCRQMALLHQTCLEVPSSQHSGATLLGSASVDVMKEGIHLPDIVVYTIFSYLTGPELCVMKRVCPHWYKIANQDSLWHGLVLRVWHLSSDATLSSRCDSWQSEFRRLWFCTPSQLLETITEHGDEVLHVSFSHNGRLFSTTSRDCSVKVWALGKPTHLLHSYYLRHHPKWEYTHSSYFNQSDTLLMVHVLSRNPIPQGFIAVLAIRPQGLALAAVLPVDIGAWITDNTFIGSTWELFRNNLQLQVKSFEVNVDERVELMEELVRHNLRQLEEVQNVKRMLLFALPGAFDVIGHLSIIPHPENPSHPTNVPSSSTSAAASGAGTSRQLHSPGGARPELESSQENHQRRQLSSLLSDCSLLTLGSRLRNELHLLSLPDSEVFKPGGEETMEQGEEDGGPLRVIHLENMVDRVLAIQGRVSGICLSPNRRHLFINCRPWSQPPDNLHPQPKLSHGLEVRLIDLQTFRETGVRYSGHQGFYPSMFCTIEPDSSLDLVASGSTDAQGYVWDRHHGCIVARLPHSHGVVNTVSFLPHNQECIITVGDDHNIKVWVSRNLQAKLTAENARGSDIICGM